jgi:hypothetical protein
LAKPEYRPAKSIEVIDRLSSVNGQWSFKAARLSDRGVAIDLIKPGLVAHPEAGDEIQFGIQITNSETGFRGLKASLFSLRLVCTNGAVLADEYGTARWNYDRRMSHSTSINKFFENVLALETKHERQRSLYQGITDRHLMDTEFLRLLRRLRAALRSDADSLDTLLGIESAERKAIQAAVHDREYGEPPALTEFGVYDFHNRITAAAQRLPFHQRMSLEELGGAMLTPESLN